MISSRTVSAGTALVRRLAARLAGVSRAVSDRMLRPGELLVLGEDSPCFRAMAASSPVLFDHLDDAIAERIGRLPGGREITARYAAFLAVPLAARGAVVGCAAFGRTAGAQAFGAGDVALAAELASRAAVCIENAQRYDRERRTARALQRSLLPGRPRVPAGLEVAHRYQPVGASMVGGDWHDIVPLPGGRAALIVGDTMGHGPEAAAVMVQLRTAAHTLAELELPPEQILHRLDLMAAGLATAPFATCIYTVIDPLDRSCVIAQAGSPAARGRAPGRNDAAARSAAGTAAGPAGRLLRGQREGRSSRPARSASLRGPRWPCTPMAWSRAAAGHSMMASDRYGTLSPRRSACPGRS